MINNEIIHVVELNISNSKLTPLLYALLLQGDNRDTIMRTGQKILLFESNSLEKVNNLLFKRGYNKKILKEDLEDAFQFCDIPEAINYILNKNKVKNSWLLNAINTILDVLATINTDIPKKSYDLLSSFADHLTFNLEYQSFFNNYQERKELENILYWFSGLIIHKSTII